MNKNLSEQSPAYARILLKFSGEALMGRQAFGLDAAVLRQVALKVYSLVNAGVQVALVVGGGNIFRGTGLSDAGIERVTGDQMGMLATVMNALAMKDALRKAGLAARVLSAIALPAVCETYQTDTAIRCLRKGEVVIFAAGTGNPFFTTDTAASLRAIEIKADVMIKATKVDGVYDTDPLKNPQAQRFTELSFDQAIERQLAVMDLTAMVLCRDHGMPIRVLNMLDDQQLSDLVILGKPVGTLVY